MFLEGEDVKTWIWLVILLACLIAVYTALVITNLWFIVGIGLIILGLVIMSLVVILIWIGLNGLITRLRQRRVKQ